MDFKSSIEKIPGVTTDPRIQFGNNVRRERLKRGLSQEALAEKADLDRTYISGIERGVRNVSLVNIVAIARALDTLPSRLMQNIDGNE